MERQYSHLTWKNRLKIRRMLDERRKPKEIADALHVHTSTIYREIKRGKTVQRTTELIDREIYCPDVAENKYRANLAAKGPALKLGNDYKLAAYIEQKIVEERYSPEAVLLKIKEERLTFSVTLSKWTLYSYITKGVFLGVTNKNLPRKGKKKKQGVSEGPGRAPSTGRQHRRPPGGDRGTSDARRLGDGHGGILQEGRGPAPGADGADVPPGDHHKNAGRHYSERRPVAGQAGKEAGVADVPPDIPHDHRGQWQRVRRLRGHGAVMPDKAGADAHILLPSVQRLRARQQREREHPYSAVAPERDEALRGIAGGDQANPSLDEQLPANGFRRALCEHGADRVDGGGGRAAPARSYLREKRTHNTRK